MRHHTLQGPETCRLTWSSQQHMTGSGCSYSTPGWRQVTWCVDPSWPALFKPQLCHLLTGRPWVNHLTSLSLSFPICSVQFSRSVVSNSLQPHEPQHTRPPYLSPVPRVYLNPCSLSRCCHLILGRPLLLLTSMIPSIRVFSNESSLRIRWPKYWSFSFSISPSSEHPGLISFRMD